MRVKDVILKCTGYVAEVIEDASTDCEYDPVGTGFFVSVPSTALVGGSWTYFVTARHVAHDLTGKKVAFQVNSEDGTKTEVESILPVWYFHPDTDIALTALGSLRGYDVLPVSTRSFVTDPVIAEQNIGIGDDVFSVGLFIHAPGNKRNTPIIRMGNIAMLPHDQIWIDMGDESKFVDAYLLEARSIGGISGSPVFVRPSKFVRAPNESGVEVLVGGVGGSPFLLGLMHGHWDIKESEINKTDWKHDAKRGVNSGISIVIPAQRILDLLNDPKLAAMREKGDKKILDSMLPHAD